MYKFINNYSEPVTLTASAGAVTLALPDGKYRLSIADAAQNATRWEIVDAAVVSGTATLTRALEGTTAQEWPASSVIYNTITAGIMDMLMAGGGDPVDPPTGDEYISVIAHADGGVTYVATEAAEAGTFYEHEGKWFYIASDMDDLYDLLGLWDKAEYSEDPHAVIDVQVGDIAKPLAADRIITTRVNWSGTRGLLRARTIFNQYIGSFDISGFVSLASAFSQAAEYNQPMINWNTSKVARFDDAFLMADKYNQPLPWDVSGAKSRGDFENMFNFAESFNQDLSAWCVPTIAAPPSLFDNGATAWVLPKPIWGTCPA